MPLPIEQKREILQLITRLAGKLQDIEFDLWLREEEELAKNVRAALDDLFARIDRLRGEIAKEWSESAAALIDVLRGSNERLQRTLRDLQNEANAPVRVENALVVVAETVTAVSGELGTTAADDAQA